MSLSNSVRSLLLILSCASLANVGQAIGTASPATLDEVLVTGERPGPGMWHVSKEAHDLWILATLEPLPKKMVWHSTAVETRIATSQAVLSPPEFDANIGFFRGLTLLPSLLRAKKSPDGLTLEQVLPHDMYIRWLALRVKYLGNGGGDEQLRPMLAALDLYTHALDESGLASDDSIWKVVQENARKHRVPIFPVVAKLTVSDPKSSIRGLGLISREAEIACLATTMKRLETDLQPMRQRANLWSLGDIEGLRSMAYPDERVVCLDAFLSVPTLRVQLEQARATLLEAWLTSAQTAIAKNVSTFAVLPIAEMFNSDGYLARLRALGYIIQEP